MPTNVLRTEAELPSTRVLALPSTFTITVYLTQPVPNLQDGGEDAHLALFPNIHSGGEDTNAAFASTVENPN